MIFKNLQCEILRDGKSKNGMVSFVASTGNTDRYGDIVNQSGWDVSKYKNNPVILLNHDSNSLPIGKGTVEIVNNQLMVDVEFDMDDPIAKEVARKTKAGFLNAVSVGFNPMDSTPRAMLEKSHPAYGQTGNYFDKAELLEISIVTIPANGEAVAAKNYKSKNRLFKISDLKHILDVEMTDDTVIVTYARMEKDQKKPEPEMEQAMKDPEDLEEEEKEESEEKYHGDDHSDDDDDDKKEKFLNPQERDFLRLLLMEI